MSEPINRYYTNDQVIGRECKNIAYTTDDDKKNDCVVITEIVHTNDDRRITELRIMENVRRPIYITKKEHRNHKEKKTYEKKENCVELHTTDVRMCHTVQMGLGSNTPNPKARLKQVCKSPYVYWADLPVTSWLKHRYKTKWPNLVSANRLAIYDVETKDVGKEQIPDMMSVIVDNEIHLWMDKEYEERTEGGRAKVTEVCERLLRRVPFTRDAKGKKLDHIEQRDLLEGFELFVHVAPTPGRCIVEMMQIVHDKMPDLFVAWNHEFDISRMMETLAREGIDPADVFCHPDVPAKYRKVWWKKDQASKKTESKTLTKLPADQWHVLYCMASFYCIDAMCVFRKLRVHEGNRPSYKLSRILETEVGVSKLDLPGLPYEDGPDWHRRARESYPAEYCAYNIMDNLLIWLLDKKTNDLSSAVSVLAGLSMLDIFPSLPKRLCVAFTFYLIEQDMVIGSVGADIRNEFDEEVIGTDGWIVTLPAYANAENGLSVIAEIENFYSAFRTQTADADLTQAYPTATNATNQERETTLIELISIEGVPEEARRRCGINLTAGRVNAMEIATDLYNLPDKDVVLELFRAHMGLPANDDTVDCEDIAA